MSTRRLIVSAVFTFSCLFLVTCTSGEPASVETTLSVTLAATGVRAEDEGKQVEQFTPTPVTVETDIPEQETPIVPTAIALTPSHMPAGLIGRWQFDVADPGNTVGDLRLVDFFQDGTVIAYKYFADDMIPSEEVLKITSFEEDDILRGKRVFYPDYGVLNSGADSSTDEDSGLIELRYSLPADDTLILVDTNGYGTIAGQRVDEAQGSSYSKPLLIDEERDIVGIWEYLTLDDRTLITEFFSNGFVAVQLPATGEVYLLMQYSFSEDGQLVIGTEAGEPLVTGNIYFPAEDTLVFAGSDMNSYSLIPTVQWRLAGVPRTLKAASQHMLAGEWISNNGDILEFFEDGTLIRRFADGSPDAVKLDAVRIEGDQTLVEYPRDSNSSMEISAFIAEGEDRSLYLSNGGFGGSIFRRVGE